MINNRETRGKTVPFGIGEPVVVEVVGAGMGAGGQARARGGAGAGARESSRAGEPELRRCAGE